MDVDCLLDLGLSHFQGLIAFVLGLEVARLEVMEESANFVSLLPDFVFKILPLNFLPGLLVFAEQLLRQLYALTFWLLCVQHFGFL